MEIEIIEFYPMSFDREKETLSGTLRVRLVDLKIDLLGVFVSRKKDFWRFLLPGRRSTHHLTGEEIRYPYFVFEDKEMQRELMDQIRERGKVFIEARLADGSPLIIPEQNKNDSNEAKHSESRNNAPVPKETATVKPEVKASISSKNWITPPPRKFSRK